MLKNQCQQMLCYALLCAAPLAAAECPEALPPTYPAGVFSVTDGDEPTVTHQVTGLEWARCSLGQSWNPAEKQCAANGDASTTFAWEAALTAAEQATYAGKDDWRLPNKKELASLIEFGCFVPAIDAGVFPGTSTDAAYWTSTPLPSGFSPASAWTVDFAQGSFTSSPRTAALNVRLVRGGQ